MHFDRSALNCRRPKLIQADIRPTLLHLPIFINFDQFLDQLYLESGKKQIAKTYRNHNKDSFLPNSFPFPLVSLFPETHSLRPKERGSRRWRQETEIEKASSVKKQITNIEIEQFKHSEVNLKIRTF
eukprot:GHVO01070826.1.p1 GENE.GHVO01070826.1~~GHVO01070826.1.p1  ORF type:complete len:127 (-),score=0.11 GHVO01070826.1:595-975(-)